MRIERRGENAGRGGGNQGAVDLLKGWSLISGVFGFAFADAPSRQDALDERARRQGGLTTGWEAAHRLAFF